MERGRREVKNIHLGNWIEGVEHIPPPTVANCNDLELSETFVAFANLMELACDIVFIKFSSALE